MLMSFVKYRKYFNDRAVRAGGALTLAVVMCVLASCEQPMDLNSLPQQPTSKRDTMYVSIDPPFGGFSGPEGILLGKDQLLYVADTRANRVVMLNRAGVELSERPMLHPVALSQDSRLDLLVGGEVVASNGDTVGALFRMHLVSASPDSAHRLDRARVDTIWREFAHPSRRFPGITVLNDNTYLAVRNGPDNSSFIDPDTRVLQFDAEDNFITPVPAFVTGTGTGIVNINHPTSIVAFTSNKNFILTQSSEGVAYGALWMAYQSNTDFVGWVPRFDPAKAEDRLSDFIRPNRYANARAVAIDAARGDVFIADAKLDSIFKFTSRGVLKSETFGLVRSGRQMLRPTGLAFFEKILYVLDGDRGVIFRYRLSIDVPR
jgi:hypothetical protein